MRMGAVEFGPLPTAADAGSAALFCCRWCGSAWLLCRATEELETGFHQPQFRYSFCRFSFARCPSAPDWPRSWNATVPMFGALIAGWLRTDLLPGLRAGHRLFRRRAAGMGPDDFKPDASGRGKSGAVLACLLALFYGISASYTRRYLSVCRHW
jgi:hypothetical protein